MSATAYLCAKCARVAKEDGATIGVVNVSRTCAKCLCDAWPVWLARWFPPVPNAGTHWGEIAGYRAWFVTEDMRLYSMAARTEWLPGEPMVAHAELQPYRSDIGVHAWKTFEEALNYALGQPKVVVGIGCPCAYVIGEVELWGDVIEYEHGYRASHAAVSAIHNIGGNWHPMVTADDVLDRLREVYGVGGEAREVAEGSYEADVIGAAFLAKPGTYVPIPPSQAKAISRHLAALYHRPVQAAATAATNYDPLRNVYYDAAYQAQLAQDIRNSAPQHPFTALKPKFSKPPNGDAETITVSWPVIFGTIAVVAALVWLASL